MIQSDVFSPLQHNYSSNNLNNNVTESVIHFNKSTTNIKIQHTIPLNFNFFWYDYCEGSVKTNKLTSGSNFLEKKSVRLLNGKINDFLQKMNKRIIDFPKKQKPCQFGNWFRWKNNENRFYYQNKKTGIIQWNQPIEVKQGLDKFNWIEFITLKGIRFYCNILTKEQTYKRPINTNINKHLKLPLILSFKKCEIQNKTKITLKDISQMKIIKINWANTLQKEITTINNERLNQLVDNSRIKYSNKKERKRAFINLLKEKYVRFDEKWEKVLKRIINDVRYRVITTLKLRKEFFFKYQKDLIEEKKERNRQEKKKTKVDFLQLMKECLTIKPGFRFRHLVEILQKEKRFKAVKNEDDRYRYFMDYVKQLSRTKKIEQKKAKDSFRSLLENCRSLKYNSSRRDVEKLFKNNKIWNNENLNNEIRHRIFHLRVEQLRREYIEIKRKTHLERLTHEKKDDDNFCELLYDLSFKKNPPLLHSKTSYGDFLKLDNVLNDFRFKVYDEKYRKASRYRQFEKFCWIIESKLRRDKKILKNLLKKKHINVSPNNSIISLMEKVNGFIEKKIKIENIRILFFEMISKAVYNEEKKSKRQKKENIKLHV